MTEPAPADAPDDRDLVFCALGNTGTGSAAQRRIGGAIADLAASGPLDFTLLLGDLVVPGGVDSMTHPGFRRGFEEPYPDVRLPMLFHGVLGDRDHAGRMAAFSDYARSSPRLSIPNLAYQFTVACHGKQVLFVGVDTTSYVHGVRDPAMRFVNRVLQSALRDTEADLKVVFGHHSMYGSGVDAGDAGKRMRAYLERPFREASVDLYVSGGPHHLELTEGEGGLVEVVSGTGGGLARSVTADPACRFASVEPGFAWFRYDGETMEVSFRAADGRVLHVHRWRPR